MNESGPLSDYRVLELGSTAAGPFCARLLADAYIRNDIEMWTKVVREANIKLTQ
jgi:hypothetical protein